MPMLESCRWYTAQAAEVPVPDVTEAKADQKHATGAVASAAKPAAGAKVAAKVTPKPVPRVEEPEDDTDQIATGSVE